MTQDEIDLFKAQLRRDGYEKVYQDLVPETMECQDALRLLYLMSNIPKLWKYLKGFIEGSTD